MNVLLSKITAQQKLLNTYRPFATESIKNWAEWFKIELTYTSNAIEGNTLTRQETAMVVEKGITVAGKTLNEHLEAVNHAQAFEFMKTLVDKKRPNFTEHDLLNLHQIILSKIDDTHAGRYRNVPIRIAGSTVVLPNPLKVPTLMSEFMKWLHAPHAKNHPAQIAAEAHFKLISIHPFTDGNGRTARLLMNLLLMQEGLPPALIKKEDRLKYINAIEKGQLSGDKNDYYRVIYEGILHSFTIYLKSVDPQRQKEKMPTLTSKKLLKIGELAKASGESVPTLRYWTWEGLLDIASHTPSGYQLYESTMIQRIKKIRQLQKEKRLTLQEIKENGAW